MSLHAVSEPLDEEFFPQAILSLRESDARHRYDLREGTDDFDHYLGRTFILDEDDYFSLKRYAGHPPDTFTIYMPARFTNIGEITRKVFRIVDQLDLPRAAVTWERSRDPDL